MLIEHILKEYYLGTNFVLMTPEFNDKMFMIPNKDYTIKGQTTTYKGKLKLNSRVINKFAGSRTPIAQLKSFPEEIYADASDDMKAAIKKATRDGAFVNFRSIPGNKVVVRVWDPETWNMLPQSTNRFLMNTESFKKMLATEVEEIPIDVDGDGQPDGPKPDPDGPKPDPDKPIEFDKGSPFNPIDWSPEENQLAQAEYNLLKRKDPDFADRFMNAYNELGNVDAAYEKARRETQDDLARKKRELKKSKPKKLTTAEERQDRRAIELYMNLRRERPKIAELFLQNYKKQVRKGIHDIDAAMAQTEKDVSSKLGFRDAMSDLYNKPGGGKDTMKDIGTGLVKGAGYLGGKVWDGTKWVARKTKDAIDNYDPDIHPNDKGPLMLTFNIRDGRGTSLQRNDRVQYKAAKNYPASGVKKGDLVTGTILGLTGDKYRAKSTGRISTCSGNQVLVKGSRGMFCKNAQDLIKVS